MSHGPFWVTFEGGMKVCVEAESMDAAKEKATKATQTQRAVISAQPLPYAAAPIVGDRLPYEFQGGSLHIQPTFCYKPDQCAGRGACPQSRSCTE